MGEKGQFSIGIDTLQKNVGSNSPAKKFRFFLKEIAKDSHILDYSIHLDRNKVVFSRNAHKVIAAQGDFAFCATRLQVKPETLDKARKAAPGYDVYHLLAEWQEFAASKPAPRNADAAFIGFCQSRHKRSPLV